LKLTFQDLECPGEITLPCCVTAEVLAKDHSRARNDLGAVGTPQDGQEIDPLQ
jgi:hypothetical protein